MYKFSGSISVFTVRREDDKDFTDIAVLFVAGFGPITQNTALSHAFYGETLGLPLQRMAGNDDYLLTEQDALAGVAFCPLAAGRRRPPALAVKSGRQICPSPGVD
jgi:hypothetical protein